MLGGLCTLLLAAAPVMAVAPPPEAFVQAATDAGLICEEFSSGTDATQHLCASPGASTERYWHASVDAFDLGLNLSVGRNVFTGGLQPAEADVRALMVEFVTLALDGDEESRALAWLTDMNDGPQVSGDLTLGDWELSWSTEEWASEDGDASGITLDLRQLAQVPPGAAPTPAVAVEQDAYDECVLLTPDDVEQVTGLTARDGAPVEIWTGFIGCGWGTSPYEVQVTVTDAFGDPATMLGSGGAQGEPVDDVGDLARWHWCELCGDGGTSWSANNLRVAAGDRLLQVVLMPVDAAAGDASRYVEETHRAWATELARLIIPRLSDATPRVSEQPAPSNGGWPRSGPVTPAAPTAGRPFADAVPTVGEISTDPIVLLQSAMLAALLVFLMPFPSQLFNSTLETHEDEVRRWFRLDRLGSAAAGIGAFWASWPGVAAFTVLAALLYGFLDPGFGLDAGSLATFAGMLLGIVLVTAAFAVPVVLAHRRIGSAWTPKVVPLSLLIGVVCVLLSRLTGFQPGYLYGLLIGLAFARELSAADEGRATAIGAVAMLSVALVAWLSLGALPAGDAFGLVVARTTLAALMVAGLEGVVFGLLPMRFLPGEPLYAWSRMAWGTLLAIGGFAFFHILINPASGYLSDTSRTPLLTVVGLLVGFSLVSVAFWAWFRFRAGQAETPSEA